MVDEMKVLTCISSARARWQWATIFCEVYNIHEAHNQQAPYSFREPELLKYLHLADSFHSIVNK